MAVQSVLGIVLRHRLFRDLFLCASQALDSQLKSYAHCYITLSLTCHGTRHYHRVRPFIVAQFDWTGEKTLSALHGILQGWVNLHTHTNEQRTVIRPVCVIKNQNETPNWQRLVLNEQREHTNSLRPNEIAGLVSDFLRLFFLLVAIWAATTSPRPLSFQCPVRFGCSI